MLLPYNVDRPTRRTPFVTYWLMGINIAIFLLTVVVANLNWHDERPQLDEFLQSQGLNQDLEPEGEPRGSNGSNSDSSGSDSSGSSESSDGASSGAPDSNAPGASPVPATPGLDPNRPGGLDPNRPGGPGTSGAPSGSGSSAQSFGSVGFQMSSDVPTATPIDPNAPGANSGNAPGSDSSASAADTRPGSEPARELNPEDASKIYKLAWLYEHRDDAFVLEPYPSTLDVFAYHAADPTLLGMFASMFLHGGLEHLLGNMLMLWLFGRALEDVIGHWIYLGAYLICGVAATFLFHVMMMTFTPQSAGVHALGASGAIAGVLGAFAPRFYRTPVSIFYTNFYGFRILALGSAVLGGILAKSMGSPGLTLGFLIVLGLLVWWGEDAAWGQFQAAAAWVIAFWIVVQNIAPALFQLYLGVQGGSGIAYWAHIGGFGFGMLYALLIGSKSEGKAEYLIEDARRALDNKYATNAMEHAVALQKLKPNDPVSYQILAEAHDHKGNAEQALDNYEIAIDKYLKNNERENAARLYLEVLPKHPLFIMPPATQFTLASHLATVGEYAHAAENLAKIPFTFPDAPENEKSLMGAAQLYLKHVKQPQMAYTMLSTLLQRYPESQYKLQAENGIKMAQQMIASPEFAQSQPKVWEPSTKKISEVQAQRKA